MIDVGGFTGLPEAEQRPSGAVGVSDLGSVWKLESGAGRGILRAARAGQHLVLVVGCCAANDSELTALAALAAQGRVGDDIASKWAGSYQVCHVSPTLVSVWTDLGGIWPVYTIAVDGGVYWSTSSRVLSGRLGRGVDLDWIAATVLAPEAPELVATRSAFAGVHRVPPGFRLDLSMAGPARTTPVWAPVPRDGHPAAELRRELELAAAARLDTSLAASADLSGGFDSTAIALTAAELLAPDRAITAVTLHPDGVWSGGDLDYARQAGRHRGIRHRFLPLNDQHLPYSRLDELPLTDEPAPSTVTYALFASQLDWLRDSIGSDCHFTGDGADALLCSPPVMIAELLKAGQIRRAVSEAIAWARLRREPPTRLLRAALRTSRTAPGTGYGRYARFLANGSRDDGHYPDVSWGPDPWLPAWATAVARERLIEVADSYAAAVAGQHSDDLTTRAIALAMGEVGRTARADVQLAAHHGVALHNPFIDSRIIQTALSVPLAERPGPATYKPILLEAMTGLFPASLQKRTTKGSYTADAYRGIRANLAQLVDLVDGHLAGHDLVDVPHLQRAIHVMAAGAPNPMAGFEPVLMAEAWLRTLSATRSVDWEPALVRQENHGAR